LSRTACSGTWFLGETALDQVRVVGRHPLDGIGRTDPCDGTFIAVVAEIMLDLKVQGSIAERGTSLHALGTAYAKIFIDLILKIGLLNEFSLQCSRGTKLVLSTCIQPDRTRYEITATKVAVTTQVIGMHTFYSGRIADTFCGTAAALVALKGIDLPDPVLSGGMLQGHSSDPSY
jgi:hypothetical protein